MGNSAYGVLSEDHKIYDTLTKAKPYVTSISWDCKVLGIEKYRILYSGLKKKLILQNSQDFKQY